MARFAGLCLIGIALAAVGPPRLGAQPDSIVDLDRLRAEARAHPDSFPAVFAYGQALARATNERPGDWRPRADARKVLDEAYRLRPEDPHVLIEIGLLMRKQGFRPDAIRILERAERRADERAETLSPHDRAEFHYGLGLIYETRWEDAENFGILEPGFLTGSCPHIANYYGPGAVVPSDPRANLLMYNVVCPDLFDEMMGYWHQPEGFYETDYTYMMRHFRAAVAADPTDRRAALRLLRHLAAGRMWEEFLATAEPLARQHPPDPYALMFLGLAYHQTGRRERADSAFTEAIAHADPSLRRDMLQPEQLLRHQDSTAFTRLAPERQGVLTDAFWRARDPLFLSVENERLAEHIARLAYVEVSYASPASGLRGRWSDRGAAWLRWGRPLRIRAISGGDGQYLEFWDYGQGSPDLVFSRLRTFARGARYEELSKEYMRWARDRAPEIYLPEHPRMVPGASFQAAAFRDTAGSAVLEVYAVLPGDALRAGSDVASFDAGVFVVTGDYWEHRAARRWTLDNRVDTITLDARFSLQAGPYVVSVEAEAGTVATRQRDRVEIPAFGTALALSDLLVVDRFGTDTTRVDHRAALAPGVSRDLRFAAGAPIGVLWEIYGLRPDTTGVAHYRVRAGVADAEHKDARVRLLGDDAPGGLEWEVSRAPRADGTVVEFVTFDLPDARPGAYRVFITITDRATGRTFTAHRVLAITGS